MAAVLIRPRITPEDRLSLTFCLAIGVHALLVLGVGFTPPERPKPRFDTMEVILVQQHSTSEPEEADFLAQANLEGSGEQDTADRPSSPLSEPLPQVDPEVSPPATTSAEPGADPELAQTAAADAPQVESSEMPPVEDPTQQPTEQLAVETDIAETAVPKPPAESSPPTQIADQSATVTARPRARPSAADLIASSLAVASLNAEIQERLAAKAKRPRRKFISASTREYKYAAYMESWRAKVERVGNLNYPDIARHDKLSGNLILEVQINPDGSVREMVVRRSSGHKILDDAARRIVELAAPFAPFPDAVAKEVDVLHVTRTWQFLNSYKFSGR